MDYSQERLLNKIIKASNEISLALVASKLLIRQVLGEISTTYFFGYPHLLGVTFVATIY